MQRVSEASLLDIWDAGQALSYHQRALLLLRLGAPQTDSEHWLDQPVGHCNAALLQLRRLMFGSRLVSVETCGECGQLVECCTDIEDLLQHEAPQPGEALQSGEAPQLDEKTAASHTIKIPLPGTEIQCRLPTPRDINAVIGTESAIDSGDCGDPDNIDASGALLARCLESGELSPQNLSTATLQLIDEALAAADPLASISFLLRCDNCNHQWDAPFDILTFLWQECAMDARRLLMQVHNLASVYHWSEAYILQLSERRRQFYLECIGA